MAYNQKPLSKSHKTNYVREKDEWDFRMEPNQFRAMLRHISRLPRRLIKKEFRDRDYMMMVLLGNTGMRIGELIILEKTHLSRINAKYPLIMVPTLKQDKLKGKPVYLHPRVAGKIKEYMASYVRENDRFIFEGMSGEGHLSDRWVRQIFYSYVDALGFEEKYSPHCLRHMFIANTFNKTRDEIFVRDQARHASMGKGLGVTEKYLGKYNPREKYDLAIKTGAMV